MQLSYKKVTPSQCAMLPAGLRSSRDLVAGEAALTSRPFVHLQRLAAPPLAACAYCTTLLGEPETQLQLLAGNATREALAGCTTPCLHACGQLYCSPDCRAASSAAGHALLCTGRLESEDEPLYLFKLHALELAAAEEGEDADVDQAEALLLAAQLLVRAACTPHGSDSDADAVREALLATPPWWEAAALEPGAEGEEALRLALREEVTEAWTLLHAGLASSLAHAWTEETEAAAAAAAAASALLTLPCFAAALTLASLRSTECERETPLHALLDGGWLPPPACAASVSTLLSSPSQSPEEEETEEDVDAEPARLRSRLPPLRILALFPSLFPIPHSCAPNCALSFDAHCCASLTLTLPTLPSASQLTRCFIHETGLDWADRQNALLALRLPSPCPCPLCCCEAQLLRLSGAKHAASPPLSAPASTVAAEAATPQLAEAAWRLALCEERDERQLGRIWDGLTTALIEQGRWAEAEAVAARGLGQAPAYPPLVLAAATRAAYPPVPIDLSPSGADGAAHARTLRLPFGNGGRAALLSGAFSPAACAAAIAEAEAAAVAGGGWGSRRHVTVPTTDVPLAQLPGALAAFNAALRESIAPLAARTFPSLLRKLAAAAAAGGGEEVGEGAGEVVPMLRVHDAFLVRYDAAGGQASLPLHRDQGELSLTLALNEGFEGGGTEFERGGVVGLNELGLALLFPSRAVHGGATVSSGRRYIIVAFCWVDGRVAASL